MKTTRPEIFFETQNYGTACKHEIVYNSELNFIFCNKCGIRWVLEKQEPITTVSTYHIGDNPRQYDIR